MALRSGAAVLPADRGVPAALVPPEGRILVSPESRRTAGILLVVFPTVIYGGISLLMFLIDRSLGLHGQSGPSKPVPCRARARRRTSCAVARGFALRG